jgi:hypothetical protein
MRSDKVPKPKPKVNQKKAVHIYHDLSQINSLNDHPINKAITMINNIVRLIFKNTKETSAVTFSSGG